MQITKHNQETLLNTLIDRVKDFEQRERIVLKFPFSHDINRIEIYCSETEPKDTAGSMFSGDKFNGIVSLKVFKDYSNKHIESSSYSYKKEFMNYLPKLISVIYSKL